MTRRRSIRASDLCAVAAVLFFGWVWLVASFKPHEMIVGAVVVAISTAFCGLLFSTSGLPLQVQWRDLLLFWRVPLAIVQDTGVLIAVLFADLFRGRPAGSFYCVCGFKSSRRDPVIVGRMALAVMYTTMSPNTIVIGVDPTQSHMLFHQLQRGVVPRLTQMLGAGR